MGCDDLGRLQLPQRASNAFAARFRNANALLDLCDALLDLVVAARRIANQADVDDVIALLRLNYNRVAARATAEGGSSTLLATGVNRSLERLKRET